MIRDTTVVKYLTADDVAAIFRKKSGLVWIKRNVSRLFVEMRFPQPVQGNVLDAANDEPLWDPRDVAAWQSERRTHIDAAHAGPQAERLVVDLYDNLLAFPSKESA